MTIDEDFVFPIYISQKVLQQIIKICKNNRFEVFGYLVGERYTWKQKNYVIINHYLFKEEAVHGMRALVEESGETNIAHDDRDRLDTIEFEFLKYVDEFEKLKRKENNDNLLNIGWWHSHPGFGCFLSHIDIATQKDIFFQPYHVALVVDPIRNELAFFTLDKNSKKGYREIDFATIA
ncbi:MAG: hypothetical protein ACFFBP_09230 [Promethearchaeota archaeon]